MFYEAVAQFAKANAPSFRTDGFEEYLLEAKDHFNVRSRVASNPKEITELSIIDDETIRIVFRSQEVLNISQVSRSLRVFSMYLVDETHPLNFSHLITGKRLFRMVASELPDGNIAPQDAVARTDGTIEAPADNLLLLRRIIDILEINDEEARTTITEVNAVVEDFFRRRC